MYTMRFDMRAPSAAAPVTELYSAALNMCDWAENHGCVAAVLCEHHGSEDGYLPVPLVLAAAVAARTRRLALTVVVLLPLYEPVRLAEEMAVLDIVSRGRVSYVLGLGYRPEEYQHVGVKLRARGRLADEKIGLLRKLLAGEEALHEGRRIRVTPPPFTPGGPLLMWGGGTLAAARRAGRYGLGLLAQNNLPGMLETYEAACHEHGHEPRGTLLPDRDTPSVCFVADDVDQAWAELGPYLLHDARTYAAWNPGNETSAGISRAGTVDELRATSKSHRIVSVPEAIDRVRNGGMLNLAPLCGGLSPAIAWRYLKRVGTAVMAEAPGKSQEAPDGNIIAGLQGAATPVAKTR